MRLRTIVIFLSLLVPPVAWASSAVESYVVLGSYRDLHAAKREAERLEQKHGMGLFVAAVAGSSGRLYRITTGPLNEIMAQATRRSLQSEGIPDGWIWRGTPELVYASDESPSKVPGEDEPITPAVETLPAATTTHTQIIQETERIEQAPGRSGTAVEEIASSRSWGLRGYLKSYGLAQNSIDIDGAPDGLVDEDPLYQSQNSLRLMFEGSPTESLAWELHYELTPVFYSAPVEFIPFGTSTIAIGANSYRVTDIDPVLGTASEKSVTLQNLDRLNVQLRLGPGDLTIGRQAIAFGSARVINPTDVFLPFEAQTLNQEYRIGVDAIRFQQSMGDLGELDMGIILGKDADAENSAMFIQAVNNFSGMDLQAAIMRFSDQNLAGFGVQSSLGDFGFWLEVAHVWNDDEYTRASTGLDYAFSENVFGMVEYHFNGAGSDSPEQYLDLFDDFAYRKGGVFLLGRNYIIPALNWTATPLLVISLQAIVNLDDSSAFVNLSGEYSVSENLYSDFGVYVFSGDQLEYTSLPPNILLRSEYGINPNLVYLSLRYYF
jgi:hypothetical protein